MKIKFLGAAKMVTGSNYLITTENEKFIIDCGLFQGKKEEEQLNEEGFKFDPKEIDFVILSHAHMDHSGRIPLLVKKGFAKKIYATKPTVDLSEIMLLDSAKIQESDTEWENKRRVRSGKPKIEPLYTTKDAELSLNYFYPCFYNELITVNNNIAIRFSDAGHILGSSIVEVWVKEGKDITKLVFSGDLGMPNRPIINSPTFIEEADYVLIESTYGNTVHEKLENNVNDLIKIIENTTAKGGTVIIPAFAVGRTQEILYDLNNYYEHSKHLEHYQRIPIYLDSPMGIRATKAFMDNIYFFNEKTKKQIMDGDNIFEFENLKYICTTEESMTLNKVKFPRVIISSAGMANAGRVRHHLKHNLWDENSAVVFIGYQANGTLGRILLDGKKEVKILGEDIAVKASIYDLQGFSGHADEPMLLEWMNHFKIKPKKVFVIHGEDEQEAFANTLRSNLGLDVEIPDLYSEYELLADKDKDYNEILNLENSFDIGKNLDEMYDYFINLKNNDEKLKSQNLKKEDIFAIQRNIEEVKSNILELSKYINNDKTKSPI